jgi:hypothetical protein
MKFPHGDGYIDVRVDSHGELVKVERVIIPRDGARIYCGGVAVYPPDARKLAKELLECADFVEKRSSI